MKEFSFGLLMFILCAIYLSVCALYDVLNKNKKGADYD